MKVFVLLLICLLLVAPNDQNVRGRVSSVTDGDTLKVTLGSTLVRVRLAEIDSPEMRQPGGVESKKALSRKVLGRQVRVLSEGYDRYGRLLAHIYEGKRHINYDMVKEGHAWAYRRYLKDEKFLFAEEYARDQKLGVWVKRKDRTIAPWKWRKGKR